jgi:hypothetical protein
MPALQKALDSASRLRARLRGTSKTKRSEEAERAMWTEIRDWAGRIASLDEEAGKRAAEAMARVEAGTAFPEKAEALRGQLKSEWGALRERAASTSFFRDTLADLKRELSRAGDAVSSRGGQPLMSRCDAMLGAKFISRPDFMDLYEDMAKFVAENDEAIADSLFARKVKETLEELGYELAGSAAPDGGASGAGDLRPGEARYFDSPYEGYGVMLKAGKKSLAARLVRSENSGGALRENLADEEAGRKWCGDFDKFLGMMSDAGIPLDVSARREPGEAPVATAWGVKGNRARGKRRRGRGGENEKMMTAEEDGI